MKLFIFVFPVFTKLSFLGEIFGDVDSALQDKSSRQ